MKKIQRRKLISTTQSWNFSIAALFWYTMSSPTKFFGSRQDVFDGKSWSYVLLHKIFRYLTFETFWNIRWFLTKFLGTVRQKNRRKTVMCIKVFEIPSILKLRSGSQDFFAYSETIKFVWNTWFPILMHRKFRNPNFSGRLEWLPTQFVSTVRPK